MPFTIIDGGSFISDAGSKNIDMPMSPDYMRVLNVTRLKTPITPLECVGGEWFGAKFGSGASAANRGIRYKHPNPATSSLFVDSFDTATATNGFTYVTEIPSIEAQAANAITAITAASPAVVSQTNTYADGDIIQLYGTTGMLQIGGMNFQISSSSGSGYTLLGLPAAGFAAAGTAGFTRRVSSAGAVEPRFLFVTAISQANQAVITCSVDPSSHYVAGMKVHLSIPYSFGMTQANQVTAKIISVDSATYQITTDLNSSAFTAFAFPASTASPTAPLFATLAPAGASTQYNPVTNVQTGYDFQYQPFRAGQFVPYMKLGGGGSANLTGIADDVINWMAYKLET